MSQLHTLKVVLKRTNVLPLDLRKASIMNAIAENAVGVFAGIDAIRNYNGTLVTVGNNVQCKVISFDEHAETAVVEWLSKKPLSSYVSTESELVLDVAYEYRTEYRDGYGVHPTFVKCLGFNLVFKTKVELPDEQLNVISEYSDVPKEFSDIYPLNDIQVYALLRNKAIFYCSVGDDPTIRNFACIVTGGCEYAVEVDSEGYLVDHENRTPLSSHPCRYGQLSSIQFKGERKVTELEKVYDEERLEERVSEKD